MAELPDAGIVGLINGCCTNTPVLGDELYEPDCPHSLKNPWQTVFGLAVDPEYQHRGIAKNLMNALVSRARDGDHVFMTGPADFVFDGDYPL